MADETTDPGETAVDAEVDAVPGADAAADDARRTREGNAHADYVATGPETRAAIQKWGANSPGSNAIPATGDSPPADETDKRPNES